MQVLGECYRPEDLRSAFGKCSPACRQQRSDSADPLDLRLHRLAGPILSKAIEQRDSLATTARPRKALKTPDTARK
jgi:hypothetical protein